MPKISILSCLFLVLVTSLGFARPISDDTTQDNEALLIGAVQFAATLDIYQSPEIFAETIAGELDALEAEASDAIDLAVFPEYSSAFLGLAFLSHTDRRALAANPETSLPLIHRASIQAEPYLDRIWGAEAQKRGYPILAGTALVVENGELYNRALLYGSDGGRIWSQDKVFPGAPESELLHLSTGEVDEAQPFVIKNHSIVVTICRDTYNEVWEQSLPDADLWIDIKANELPYTEEYYADALPDRLPDSPIDAGLTVSLVGEMLGYRFTGVTEYRNDWEILSVTGDPYGPDRMVITLP